MWIVARYKASCDACGQAIKPGMPIWKDESFGWIHLRECAPVWAPVEYERDIAFALVSANKAAKKAAPRGRRKRRREW